MSPLSFDSLGIRPWMAALLPALFATPGLAADAPGGLVQPADGIVYGVLLGTIVCNAALALAVRQRICLYNLLGSIFGLWTLVVVNGHAPRYLPLGVAPDVRYLALVLPSAWIVSSARFASLLLDLRRRLQAAARMLTLVQACAAIAIALALGGHFQAASLAIFVAFILGTPVALYGAVHAHREGFVPANWYLLGVLVLLACFVGIAPASAGTLRGAWTSEWFGPGVALTGIAFTVALGSRLRLLREPGNAPAQRLDNPGNPLYIDALSGAKNALGWSRLAPGLLGDRAGSALIAIHVEGLAAFRQAHGDTVHGALLHRLGDCMRMEMGPHDLHAHTSEEEFSVLLGDVPNSEILAVRTELLLGYLEQPIRVQGETFVPRVSAGVAFFPQDGTDLESLAQAAGCALTFVRAQGGLGYALYRDITG